MILEVRGTLFSEIEIGESSKRQTVFNDEIVIDFNEENIVDEDSEDDMK